MFGSALGSHYGILRRLVTLPMRAGLRLFAVPLILAALTGFPRSTSASPLVLLPGFPTLRQQHSLTCESSAASMGTRGALSESQIMSAIPRNPDPNLGFRGNPDGEQGRALVDYGVYAAPVQRALAHFDYHSEVVSYGNDSMLRSYVNQGWPVLVWVTYRLQPAVPRLAQHLGVQFILVPHEHALLLVGYDRGTIIANDPWTGTEVRYSWRDFNRSWGYFGNMALAIEPCLMPSPVPSIRLRSVSSAGITWSWKPGRYAARYAVTVTQVDGTRRVAVYQTVQTASRLTIADPVAGAQYEISVQAQSACGGTAGTRRLLVQLPDILATPTPTPAPEGTLVVTTTPTPTSTPSPSASPTKTP